MSGIAGIVNLDGEPIDPLLTERMGECLRFRGPDGSGTWTGENAAFIHTMLRANDDAQKERQPCTLDGAIWIVADARVDARADLVSSLDALGRRVPQTATDPELILHAYHAWGEGCVEHFLGDFAFGLWDGSRRRLFCARDPMGVKPFFYAHVGSHFVFSNTLDCVRLHPRVSRTLNDLAIADFLLYGFNREGDTTTFADIRRLPAGCCATVSADGVRIREYWSPPIDEPIYYRHKSDYVDQFRHLLNLAVGDRLRTKKVGVFMSGGLDSTTLAAAACSIRNGTGSTPAVYAFTTLREDPVADSERHHAGLVANHLGIPIDFRITSDEPFQYPLGIPHPEPVSSPLELIAERSYYSRVARHSRVFFYGEGPDNFLGYEWQTYLAYLRGNRGWGGMSRELLAHAIAHRRVPLLTSLPRMLKARYARPSWRAEFPTWLNEGLVARHRLRERWARLEADAPAVHPIRPRAFNSMRSVQWQALFESCDPAVMGAPVEVRHPFVDLRLLRFMLAVPVFPWCRNKYLVRYAMRNALPAKILRRPKAPLAGVPLFEKGRRSGMPGWNPTSSLADYVRVDEARPSAADSAIAFGDKLRAVGLNAWLESSHL